MKQRRRDSSEPPALDLMENAVRLLRGAPAETLLCYYAGAIPFALGLLYFWAEMTCGAFAARHCALEALGLALLFAWLKTWQAVFTAKLRAELVLGGDGDWTASRIGRLFVTQAVLQPCRLFLLPLAFIVAIPAAWAFAYFENLTVLGDGSSADLRLLARRAAAQAKLWPAQNHLLGLLFSLAALVLWLNVGIAFLALPELLKTLFGVETVFSRSGLWLMANTTFFATTVTGAWLILDPLIKAVYLLRCFHGEARRDGADLLAGLARIARHKAALAAIVAAVLALGPWRAAAAPAEPAPPQPAQLAAAIQQTLQDSKYAWRLPREKIAQDDSPSKAWWREFFSNMGATLMSWLRSIRDFLRDAYDWFNRHFKLKQPDAAGDSGGHLGMLTALRWLAYLLLAGAAVALAVLAWRLWKQRAPRSAVVAAEAVPERPDLADENTHAAQLPEDEWLRLAAELLAKGERRLGLRALYLATLAHLAGRELVSVARFKSNRDYQGEVNRRARGQPDLCAAFSTNVRSFDRVWYGLYDATTETVADFRSNFDRIRAC